MKLYMFYRVPEFRDSLAHRVRCATGASAYPMDKPYRRCGRARPAASPRPPSSRIPFNTEYRSPMAQPCSEAVLPPPSCPGQNWIGEPLWRGEALVLGEPKRPWPFSQPQPKRRSRCHFLHSPPSCNTGGKVLKNTDRPKATQAPTANAGEARGRGAAELGIPTVITGDKERSKSLRIKHWRGFRAGFDL
jgi:hypothetical protein